MPTDPHICLSCADHGIALKGRFLHITDFHPDPHYVAGATFESGCHRKPKKKGKGKDVDDDMKGDKDDDVSGRWGSAVS